MQCWASNRTQLISPAIDTGRSACSYLARGTIYTPLLSVKSGCAEQLLVAARHTRYAGFSATKITKQHRRFSARSTQGFAFPRRTPRFGLGRSISLKASMFRTDSYQTKKILHIHSLRKEFLSSVAVACPVICTAALSN